HAGMAPRDDGRGDERYPPADHVDGNHVETLPLIRRELAKIRSQKVRKRTGSIDPFIPARKGRAFRALHDRRAHDGNRQIAAPAREDGLAKTLREGVGIRPAEMLRPTQADARSEEHTSELQSLRHLVCRLLLE